MTNHLPHGNLGVKRATINLDTSDTSTPKLPDAYMIQPPVKLTQTYVFAPRLGNSKVRPPLDVRDANVKDAAWMAHVSRVLKQDTLAEDMGLQLDASKRRFGEAPCRDRSLPPYFHTRPHLHLQRST